MEAQSKKAVCCLLAAFIMGTAESPILAEKVHPFKGGTFVTQMSESNTIPDYKNSKFPIEKRIDDLLKRMTQEEKIMQLNQYLFGKNDNLNNFEKEKNRIPPTIGSCIYSSKDSRLRNRLQRYAINESRLGIPILFGYDAIHGYHTIYPIPLAQGCTWNPNLIEEACKMTAREAYEGGVNWTFSPMIDIARDPRWGRVAESYGEDPYTNARFCEASVKGYQGKDMSQPHKIAACLKHFVGYGESTGGRDYTTSEISYQTLWDTYLQPYEAGIRAGAATVMSAFNDISGTPASAHHYLLTEVLKNKWGHRGFVVSDWEAVAQLIQQGVAENRKHAAQLALSAGVEMDMIDNCYGEFLPELIKEGKISMKQVDEAVRRVLRIKFEVGLFEHPYAIEKTYSPTPNDLALAEQVALESIVLLKNNNGILPLKKGLQIAVVGPMAKNKTELLGSWKAHGTIARISSIYESLENELGTKLPYAKGCDFEGNDHSHFQEALTIAKQSDAVVLCLGEKARWSGENASRSSIALPKIQEELAAALFATGKPVILVLSNGRPLELVRLEKQAAAIVEMWQPGVAGGKPLAKILSGAEVPSGKLCITFPLTTGQIPLYYNERQSSRPMYGKYQDISSDPLYPFGYGLTYTTFSYGEPKTDSQKLTRGKTTRVDVEVTNTGNRCATETIHWYITDPVSTISRPVKELKFFEQKKIEPGKTVVFSFDIMPERDLSFVNATGESILEDGKYIIEVGGKKITLEL